MKRWFCLIMALAIAAPALALPSDRVSLGDWSYDALAHLAARGLLPGHSAAEFTGERTYSREEIASFLTRVPLEGADDSALALLRPLRLEFRQELALLGREDLIGGWEITDSPSLATPAGFLRGRFVSGPDSETSASKIFRVSLLSPIAGRGVFGITLSDQPEETSTRPDQFPTVSKLFLRYNAPMADWEIGRDSIRWGPGDIGGMLLSDTAPGFDFVRGSREIYLGRPLGSLRVSQMATKFRESGQRRFIMARRIEKSISPRFGISAMEAFKSTRLPRAPLLVLPFFWYQHLVKEDVDTWFNYLAGMDLWYKTGKGMQLYGELLLDDVQGPFGWNVGNEKTERKIGGLAGLYLPNATKNGRTDLRLEYAFTDASAKWGGTYWHQNPDVSWYHDGLPIGSPIGTGGRGLFVRVDHRISSRMRFIGSFSRLEHRTTDPPQTNQPELPPTERITALSAYLAYDLAPNQTLSLRLAPYKIRNAANIAGKSESGTIAEFAATYAF